MYEVIDMPDYEMCSLSVVMTGESEVMHQLE